MDRFKGLARYAGSVPSPFAVYRPAIVGMAGVLPFQIGIASYDIPDLDKPHGKDELATYLDEVKAAIVELDTEAKGLPFSDEQREKFAALQAAKKRIEDLATELTAREDYILSMAKAGNVEQPRKASDHAVRGVTKLPDNIYELGEYRARTSSEESMLALLRDGARKAAEVATYPHDRATPDRTVGHIHKLLGTIDDGDENTAAGILARRILATGSPVYARAFGKALRGMPLTSQEQAAIAVVGTTTAGGYAVPFQLDPTVILTSDGQVNPLRDIARVEQITGNTWKGVTSAGVTVTRGAEAAAVDPSALTLDQPEVTVEAVKAEIQFSIEADEDWARLQTEMARVLQDAKDAEEASSFVMGDGTGHAPGGIVGSLDSSSFVPTADTSGPITLALADLYSLEDEVPERFISRARFLGHRAIYNLVRQFGAGQVGEGAVWNRGIAVGQPPELIGYPAHRSSAMDSDMTAGNGLLLLGDFEFFLIAEKIGMSIELDPHVRNGDGKWTGQRAILAHWRNSTVILTDNAFRLLIAGAVS